ncbi:MULTISPECIES: glycosyltransferase [Enterobacteriaceae]|uniref:glycosyltransferase family 2 protein n=1 Tax=Enterobacteriaceae TaxID=543 RepID=UPI0002729DAC|nr:glycosyltransferase [Enterobacter sp. Ag1]EJF32309.1 glycosyltransferase [Enterobacter sp. Ag1]
MKNPLISIIIASFNAENYIRETLESCINQSYKKIEIIIVDDCSTDNSVNIISDWCEEKKKTHPGVDCTLIPSEKNNGITTNFNNALPSIKGDWIKCLGSDDLLLPDAIQNFVSRLERLKNTERLGAVFTYFETFGLHVEKPQRYPLAWTKDVIQLKPSWLKAKLSMIHFNNVAPGAFINKKHFSGFDTHFKLLEDLPLWLKFIDNNINVLFFEYTSVLYRIHANQVTSSGTSAIGKILLSDLMKVNSRRWDSGNCLSYLHHKFNLYCVSKGKKYRILKVMNPINLLIYLYERVKK